MTQISGGGAPNFRIGSAGATNNARFSNAVTPSWGEALSKIGGKWARVRSKERTQEANRVLATEQGQKRAGWAQQLSGGTTLRDLVQSDPSVLADSGFLKFWNNSAPAAKFENILDDQGRPVAQRGPQGRTFAHPMAPKTAGPAATKTDKTGFLRYFGGDQHGTRVYPDVQVPEKEPELSSTVQTYEQLLKRGHLPPGTTYADFKGSECGNGRSARSRTSMARSPISGLRPF